MLGTGRCNAFLIVQPGGTLLHFVASLAQVTLVVAIHQPRPEVWQLFSHAILLSRGRHVYCGPADGALAGTARYETKATKSKPVPVLPLDNFCRSISRLKNAPRGVCVLNGRTLCVLSESE